MKSTEFRAFQCQFRATLPALYRRLRGLDPMQAVIPTTTLLQN